MAMTNTQRVCMGLLVPLFFCAAAAYGVPYWLQVKVSEPGVGSVSVNIGLFQICGDVSTILGGGSNCRFIDFDNSYGWFEICRLLCGACASILFILCWVMCCVLCCNSHIAAKIVGVVTGIAGVLGLSGAILFAVHYQNDLSKLAPPFASIVGKVMQLYIAFYGFVAVCCLTVLVGIGLCFTSGSRLPPYRPLTESRPL